MTVQTISHSSGTLNIDFSTGDQVEVTCTGDVSAHSITGMVDGDVMAVYYKASGGNRTVDLNGFSVTGKPIGSLRVATSQTLMALFTRQFGTTYISTMLDTVRLDHNNGAVPQWLLDNAGRRAFPGFPTVSGTTHNVPLNDLAALNSVINIAQPGDEIVLADGVWNLEYGNGVTWSANETQGTAENPIIWRPATQDGVTITNVDDWIVNGEHNHFWNLNIDGGTGTGSVIRFFKPHCKWLHASIDNLTTFASALKTESEGDYLELADLDFGLVEGIAVIMAMENGAGGPGTKAKHCHFHHWTVDNSTATSPNSLVQTGTSNLAATPKDPTTQDDYTYLLFEFMDVIWNAGADSEIISIKSSGNTVRYNVVDSQGGGGHLSCRDSDDSLIYGNHQSNVSLASRANGNRNVYAYNMFIERPSGGTTATQWHLANTFGDRGSFDNRFERNLMVGNFTIAKTTDNLNTPTADPNPLRNIMRNNWWDGTNTPSSYVIDDDHSQAELLDENTIEIDWVFDGFGNPVGPIPTTLHPLEGHPDLGHNPGEFLVIPEPEWWSEAVSISSGNAVLYPTANPTPSLETVAGGAATTPRGINIHSYGPGVGEGNSGIDDAAFAWLKENHLGHPWQLGPTTYTIATPVDIRGTHGQGIIGDNRETSRIRSTNVTAPIVQLGGARGQRLENFTAIYASRATDPAAYAFEVNDDTSFLKVQSVMAWYAYVGFGLVGSTVRRFFSCSMDSFESRGWTHRAMEFDCIGGSSGNEFTNIYMNNQDGSDLSAYGVFYANLLNDSSWGQVNGEACGVTGPDGAFHFYDCQGQTISSLHLERLVVPNNDALIHVMNFRTGLNIGAMRVHDCTGGGQSSYFWNELNTRTLVDVLDNFGSSGFDAAFDGPFWGDASDTHLEVGAFIETLNNGGVALAKMVGNTLSPNLLRRFNGDHPRPFTTAQRNGLTPFRDGFTVFDSDLNKLVTWGDPNWYDGSGAVV